MSKLEKEFYTVRGYALLNQEDNRLTPSMEDYLEMAYRLAKNKGFTRMSDLAGALNVQPPSATKMVNKLAEMGYFGYEKYGVIQLTPKGNTIGRYLLKRHEVIEDLLRLIGVKDNVLEQTEKIEHNINENTLERIEVFLKFINENPDCLEKLKEFDLQEK